MGTSDDNTIDNDAVDVRIAKSGLAEEVIVMEWLVDDGTHVNAGDPLVLIESEKTQFEMEAPVAGVLEIVVAASDLDVPAGTLIARIRP
jgi:pyruvate/2-oxoglutarate dehydrogenase complex dihydrolipoamide acyltransferase (E2) component